MAELVGAIDQGTSSSRFLVFTKDDLINGGPPVCSSSEELILDYPHPGWVQIEAEVIWRSVVKCIENTAAQMKSLGYDPHSCLKTVGITNQRETCLVWDKTSGVPYGPAITWQDSRSRDIVEEFKQKEYNDTTGYHELLNNECIQNKTGLVMSEYSCCSKLVWMLRNSQELKKDLERSDRRANIVFGTIDTWLIWKLTNGAVHVTDVSNASRTNFMSLHTLSWDQNILKFFEVPSSVMPTIKSNSEFFGKITSAECECLTGIDITGCMGDQHASLVGHHCFKVGQSKNTYGTGLFLLTNIGKELKFSTKGILTTIAYQFGPNEKACFAMEGSVAIGGVAIRWLRDNLGFIETTGDVERVASQVINNGGVYFVPAFSGLYTPYWDSSARGIICGMTLNTNKHHIARAVLESLCFQTRDVLDTIQKDCELHLSELKVDGGATSNNLLMQIQANVLNMNVSRPLNVELTAYGAALAAAFGIKMIDSHEMIDNCVHNVKQICKRVQVFVPELEEEQREKMYANWKKAVGKSQNWL